MLQLMKEAPVVPQTQVRRSYGVVVLTQGRRPDDLARALASLQAQRGVELDVVVVGNGWDPTGLPPGVRSLGLPENRGIPAGRNAGVPLVSGTYLFFLDDDASLPDDGTLLAMAKRFEAKPHLGLIQPRVVDPDGRPAPRRWTPRIRVADPAKSSPAMSVWEGAVAIRREAFEYAHGWPGRFWYAHEGIELAWRVWDGGWRVRYDGRIQVHHPAIKPTRHAEFYRYQARNRVWLARRNLPVLVGIAYVLDWMIVGGLRLRGRTAWLETLRGYRMGITEDPGQRRPIAWQTVWRMAKAGHPPLL